MVNLYIEGILGAYIIIYVLHYLHLFSIIESMKSPLISLESRKKHNQIQWRVDFLAPLSLQHRFLSGKMDGVSDVFSSWSYFSKRVTTQLCRDHNLFHCNRCYRFYQPTSISYGTFFFPYGQLGQLGFPLTKMLGHFEYLEGSSQDLAVVNSPMVSLCYLRTGQGSPSKWLKSMLPNGGY